MRLLTQKVPRDFNIFLISCTHFGSRLHASSGFNSFIEKVESSYEGLPHTRNYVVHHGDHIEGILADDKRFQLSSNKTAEALPQFWEAVKAYKPVKNKIVALLEGNHDQRLWRYGNITAAISRELYGDFDRYASYTTRISWYDKKDRLLFKHFATHGRKSLGSAADDPIRVQSNLRLQLKRRLKMKAGDAFLMTRGHSHMLFHTPPIHEMYLYEDANKITSTYTKTSQGRTWIHPDHRWYVSVGAFYRIYVSEVLKYDPMRPQESVTNSYVEMGDYDPAQLGYAVAVVRDGKIQKVNEEYIA